jgi:hypothetical protein
VRDLDLKLRQAQSDLEELGESFRKSTAELKEKLTSRTEKFKRDVTLLQQKKKNLEEQFVTRLKANDNKWQRDLERAVEVQNELKVRLADTVQAMKAQAQESVELSERLSQSLAKSEKRNQQMTNEMSDLVVEKKALEAELKSLSEHMKREIQILNAQAGLKVMNAETKFQQEITALRAGFMKERHEFFISVLSEFDDLDEFDAEDITNEGFAQAMGRIAEQYHSLNQRVRTTKSSGRGVADFLRAAGHS